MLKQSERDQLERALLRAHKSGIHFLGRGVRRLDGATVYVVSSASDPQRGHLVLVSGARLVCDCAAAQRGRICIHRALVRERLLSEQQLDRATTTTDAAQRASRDTALLRRSNRPFSLLK